MKKIGIICRVLVFIFLGARVCLALDVYVSSNEATWNNISGQIAADSLDDGWRNMLSDYIIFETYTISWNTFAVGSGYTHMIYGTSSFELVASLRNMTGGWFWQLQNNTATQPERNNGASLASSSPKPLSLSGMNYWNESSVGSTSSKSVSRLSFTWLNGFWLWLADVETRSDGSGVLATIQLFDYSWSILASAWITPSTWTNQQSCGGSYVGCWNASTRFVGFIDNLKTVKYMLITVGDDDASGNGNSEHLSFIGATIAYNTTLASSVVSMSWDIITWASNLNKCYLIHQWKCIFMMSRLEWKCRTIR